LPFLRKSTLDPRATGGCSVVAENDQGWKRFLTEILRDGMQKKELGARLGAETAAEAIMAMVRA
jgi:hypothetical protein